MGEAALNIGLLFKYFNNLEWKSQTKLNPTLNLTLSYLKMEPALWFRVLASVMSLVSDQTDKAER